MDCILIVILIIIFSCVKCNGVDAEVDIQSITVTEAIEEQNLPIGHNYGLIIDEEAFTEILKEFDLL